jgi:uncharacterized membrane protein YagU involved in acid resistance
VDALVFFGFRGVAPILIFQSIASGLLGPASYEGGSATAVLGGVLHFFIAFMIVAVYFVASRRWPALARRPLRYGPLYGMLVYLTMNLVVIPLSAASSGMPPPAVLINGLLIHLLGVGLPSALFARAARSAPPFPPSSSVSPRRGRRDDRTIP